MTIKLKGIYIDRTVYLNGRKLSPARSLRAINHSPTGFAWGYGGSGPAQLALAILLHFTDKENAVKDHQNFKWEVIAKIPQENFDMEIDMSKWVKMKQFKRARSVHTRSS